MKRNTFSKLDVVGLLAICLAVPAWAQPQPGQGQGQGQGQGRGQAFGQGQQGQFDPAQIRQTQNDAIKEALGASDQEWSVLGPKIENIQQLQYAAGGGPLNSINSMQRLFARGIGGRGGQGGGGRGGGAFNLAAMMGMKDSPLQARLQDLQAALDNKDTPENQLRVKLQAVREARDRAREELARAREAMIELLTSRQEAVLFQLGILE